MKPHSHIVKQKSTNMTQPHLSIIHHFYFLLFFFFFFYIMKFKDRNSVVYVKILMGFQFITKYTFSMINKKKNSLVIQGKSIYILFV